MNEFNLAVDLAKKQQHQTMLKYVAVLVAVALFIAMIIFASRGTRVEVLPKEISSQASINISRGIAFVIYKHIYSMSSDVEIEIEAPGYIMLRKVLSKGNYGKVTTVMLQPMPGELILTSSARDDKTSWYINDVIISVASSLHKTLEPGDYFLTLNHPYFENKNLSYTLNGGQVIRETIELEFINVDMQINSIPSDALVIVDGDEIGKTPLLLTLLGGIHKIDVVKAGYDPIHEEVELKKTNMKVERNYHLSPKSAGVTVSTFPVDGILKLNGNRVSIKDKIKVNTGQKNTVTYSKPGYLSQSETFNLKSDEVKHIRFSLEEEMGTVDISSIPSANVYVNGTLVGKTPVILTLNAVAHKVELNRPGYRGISRTITPFSNEPMKIAVKLIPEAQARLMEAPKAYNNYAGDEMVLFKPNDQVVMGAVRSEPGQRANEFVRTAQITRPFYAGRHEVSNGAYAKFKADHSGDPSLPVTAITWLDAARYANWLSQNESLIPVYNVNNSRLTKINIRADGYRLLTEAEWEWLVRKAGRKQQTQFAWGDNKTLPRKAANIADESIKGSVSIYVQRYDDGKLGIAPVKSMQREQSGLYDMGGNVSEWTHDSYTLTLPPRDQVFKHELDSKILGMRVVKGANFRSGSLTELRGAYREGMVDARDDLGFRLGRFVYGE